MIAEKNTAIRLPRAQPPGYQGASYYGLPAIKNSHYRWAIAAYFFVGGLASAAQFLATAADLTGGAAVRKIVRAGRYLALAGALASPPLLIADLETPGRWYNMLRIFRPTSAMSIGSWALSLFGLFSGLAAAGQALEDLFHLRVGRWIGRLAGLPAAVFGGIVSLYTGTLLSATNIPLWASAHPFLSSLFASSAASTAAAALSLAAPAQDERPRRQLGDIALVTASAELLFAALISRGWRKDKVASPLRRPFIGLAWAGGVFGLGILTPLGIHLFERLTGRPSRRTSALASAAALIGGFLLRAVFVFGGHASGEKPQDYLRFTQPPWETTKRRRW